MIYFRRHIQALEAQLAAAEKKNRDLVDTRWHLESLESQIAYLKEQLAEAGAARAHIQSLEGQILYLKEQLVESRQESRGLLDRLLAKNNVAPVSESPAKSTRRPEILAPFGVADAEMEAAFKESFLQEEIQHFMNELGCDAGTARGYAEQSYIDRYQVIE